MRRPPLGRALLALGALLLCGPVHAAAIRNDASFYANTLSANDNGSTSAVMLGFTMNFFGTDYTSIFINNNGNATFGSKYGEKEPQFLDDVNQPILAPFFADVDTREATNGALEVTYGSGTVDGFDAFAANWVDVGYSKKMTDKLNSFQLVIISRPDRGTGEFDVEFNYDQIQWETGKPSDDSGNDGLGGVTARVGFSDGTNSGNFYEIAGSGVSGAFLDGGPAATSLVANSNQSSESGSFRFFSVGGILVPEPSTALLFGFGLLGLGLVRRR